MSLVEAATPSDAAESFASRQYDGDPFTQMDVCVRVDGGTVLTYFVSVDRDPCFTARLKTQ